MLASPDHVSGHEQHQRDNRADQREVRASRVQLAVRLLMDFKRELVFRRSFFRVNSGIIRDCLLFIDPDETGVGANKALVEDTPRQRREVFALQSLKVAPGYFGGFGYLVERDAPHLALAFQLVAK